AVAELASGPTPAAGLIVCEVSSFELAFTEMFRPDVAVVLYVADDHYDWHGDHDDYLRSKARIAAPKFTVDLLIANSADAGAMGRAVAAFCPLPHRSTVIGEVNGVRYIDDSKATNPHATLMALECLE